MSFLEIVLVIIAISVVFTMLKKALLWILGAIWYIIGLIFRFVGFILLFALVGYLIFKFFSACSAVDFHTDTAKITDLSVGYLTESDYNSGNFSDNDIDKRANFKNGATQYVVIDLTVKTVQKNEGGELIEVRAYLSEKSIDMKLESANTGNVEIVSENGGTAIYTYYGINPKKGEKKTTRIILKLEPETHGTVEFDILISGINGTQVKGKTHKTVTFRVNS